MLILLWLFFICAPASPLDVKHLLNEVSWALRLKLLGELAKSTTTSTTTTTSSSISTTEVEIAAERRVGIAPQYAAPKLRYQDPRDNRGSQDPSVLRDQRGSQDPRVLRDNRRVGVQALLGRQGPEPSPLGTSPNEDITADENNMRLKLFRLMYETVRDSDLKVKRAELIKDHYTNLTTFQIGYLMGDVTDKFNIMTDISITLTRFYKDWKPIEHINAYEQIANQAIEINHLIELMRLASRNETVRK